MHSKDWIMITRKGNLVSIRLDIGKGFTKSPFVPESQSHYHLRKMIIGKVRSLFSQRKFQLQHGMAQLTDERKKVLNNLQAKVEHTRNWKASNYKMYLRAMLPNLIQIAPDSGKYADTWVDLIAFVKAMLNDEYESKIENSLEHA